MKTPALYSRLAAAACGLALASFPSVSSAAVVTWAAYANSTVTPSITATNNGARIGGTFDEVTLSIGDSISFTGSYSFAGLNPNANDGFRFGLYDNNGNSSLSAPNEGGTFRGYTATANTTGNDGGVLLRKTNPGWYGNTTYAGTRLIQNVKATNPSNPLATTVPMIASTYNFSFTLTRTAASVLVANVSIVDAVNPSDYNFAINYTDTAAVNFDYNQVAFYLEMNSSAGARTVTFSNMAVNVIPEPATGVLAAAGFGALLLRRKTRRA